MILFILILSSLSLKASELRVSYELSNYELKINDNEMIYTNKKTFYQIKKEPCNEKVLRDLNSYLNRINSGSPLNLGEVKGKVNFILSDKKYYEEHDTKRGNFLRSLPYEVERIVRVSNAVCKK